MNDHTDNLASAGVKYLTWGSVVGTAVALIMTLLGWLVSGRQGGLGALTGCVISLVVMAAGQGVLTAVARRPPTRVLMVALVIYGTSIAAFIVLIRALHSWSEGFNGLWVSIGAGVGAYSYLSGMLLVYRKVRIPVLIPEKSQKNTPRGDTLTPHEGAS